jgi:hypothetical protein
MKSDRFARIDGLGVVTLPSCTACRTIVEPILGLILTLGLVLTLTVR